MAGLFGAHKATTHATRAMGIDFQGAQYGPVVPVVYGRNKVPGNCVWYGDFQSHAQQQKAGKGGGGGSTTNYTYSASAQMGLCEGPGITLQTVYDGTSIVNLSSLNYVFTSGAKGQAPWSHLSGPAALGYSLTALFSFQNLDLGSQASLPNYNYEVNALKQFSGGIPDANPRDILTDVCSDPYHGINFPFLGDLTQYSNYCVANGLFLSPVYDQQQTANQALSDLFKYTNAYVYYSEDQLKVVPLGDTAVTGNGVTFTPNVTPVVNLGTDDFIADGAGATVTVDRKAPQDNLNLVRVEFKDRSNTYHDSAVVGAIDEDIITNGGRSDDSETVNGCTGAAVARFIAQNLVQRAFYIRNTYQFKLTWRYCYLEPTDIVTLTDAALGLNLYPVRITEIEEDGDSALTITAEEFPEGIGHSAIYNTQPNGGTNIDQNSDPGAVNPPFLFRGPGFLVNNNTPEIWCAVNGSNPMWAGCDVYLSHDGSSYTFAGTVASQARYGQLTTALAVGAADPDTTNTPSVQVYAPAELLGGSQTDADNFVTLAMVDSEIIAYETATLQAANTYQLGYLRRGGYGSANVAHAIGAPFVRLDDSIFRMPVDPSLIGSTVYLKFLSLNAFGRTPRTLAEETAYTYVVGTNIELPDVPGVPASFGTQGVADGVSITWMNGNPAAVGCTSIEYATASGGPWTVLAQVGPTTTAYHHSFTTGATYYYRARARGPLVQSGWSAYTDVFNSTGVDVSKATVANVQTLLNGTFLLGLSNWIAAQGWTSDTTPRAIYTGFAGASGTLTLANTNNVPCQSGSQIIGQALLSSNAANGACYAGVEFLDSTGAHLAYAFGNSITGTTAATLSRKVALAPASSAFARFFLGAANCTTGTYYAQSCLMTVTLSTLDELPDSGSRFAAAQAGADKTSLNTAADTTKVNGVSSSSISPIAALMPQEAGANKTETRTSALTASLSNQTQDALGDGTTYARMKAASLTGNDFDFAKGGVNKHLGNVPDGGSRYAVINGAGLKAVSSVDANNLALIDFSQAGHVNKTIDNVGDGATYLRMPGANMDANRRGLVDFTQTGHVGKVLDNIGESPSYVRSMQGFVSETVDNADFSLPVDANGKLPGWTGQTATVAASTSVYYTPPSCAVATATSATATYWGLACDRKYPIKPSDSVHVSAELLCGAGLTESLVVTFFDGAGNDLGSSSGPTTPGAWTFVSFNAVAPAGAVYFIIEALSPSAAPVGTQIYLDQVRISINDLRVAGSGTTVGDQRNLLPTTWAGVRSVLSTSPIAFSITSGSPNSTVNFSTTAFTNYGGNGVSIPYNAASGSHAQVNGTTATYYLYFLDPTSAGGSQTLQITVFPQTLGQASGAVLIGTCVVTVASGGGGSSGTGSGGGGYCVVDSMWVDGDTQAKDAQPGHVFDCCDLPTRGTETFKRALRSVDYHDEACVRLTTEGGAQLDCGHTTPFDTVDGCVLRAPDMLGELVLTDHGLQKVVDVEWIGMRRVCYFHFGGISYASGRDTRPWWLRVLPQWLLPRRLHRNVNRIYSHNGAIKP